MKHSETSFFSFLLFIFSGFIFSGLSAQECGIVYITTGGASSGVAGTRSNPANLVYGMSLITPGANQVWLATGTYNLSATLSIPGGATLEGGFNPLTWVKSNASQSILKRDTNNINVANKALVGLTAGAVSNFRLQDLTLQVDKAPGNGISVYGIYLSACSNYNITRCTIITGDGSAGLPGFPGAVGAPGDTGTRGAPGNPNEIIIAGGAGGTGAGGNNGGAGAKSGKWDGTANTAGTDGLPAGCGGTGGNSGSGPSCSLGCAFGDPSCGSETPGIAGNPGGPGATGLAGSSGPAGIVSAGYYVPGAAGGAGISGGPGCGGGGGGGGGGRQKNGPDDVGGSGGGGGGGGGGGTGGTGGTGGGSSFAVFLFNNGVSGIIQDCLLNPGSGGAGGAGGPGGSGGSGGFGGGGGQAGACSNSTGGNGGSGGNGGKGGDGGAGSPGLSVPLIENGGTPVLNSGINGVPGNPPQITAASRGCTRSEVLFTSSVAGNWNFGAGAVPATATGTGPFSVYYSGTGRKIITQGGVTFTDYINLFQTGPASGGITPANSTVTAGCPNSFSTATAGTYYMWVFGSSANPDTVQGGSMQTASNIYFTKPGTYTIYVFVTTACCGRVMDSAKVTVNASASNVTLSANPQSACQGSSITFTANPASYAGYQFYINNVPVQNGLSNVFSTTALKPGDSVKVIALSGTCFSNPSAAVKPTITAVPVVSLSASPVTICAGQLVTFTASPSGYTSYQFFNGGNSIQNGSSNIYATTVLAPGNSITVTATNGCTGSPSNAVIITVNASPSVNAGADFTACLNDSPRTLNGTPAAGTWTGPGITAPSGTFSAAAAGPGAHSLIYNYTNSGGCNNADTVVVTVSANPVPLITGKDTVCAGSLTTLTASGGSSFSWNTGATTATISVSPGGSSSYTVAVTNVSGCSASASKAVHVNPAPATTTSSVNASCGKSNGSASVSVSNGNGPFTYSWNNGQTSSTASSLSAGTYAVIVTNSVGCMHTDQVVVSSNNMPALTLASQSNVACNGGNTGAATVNVSGGSAPLTYSWNTNPPQNTASASGLPAGNFTLTVTDSSGCVVSTAIQITQPPVLKDTAVATHGCGARTGAANASVSGGTIPYTYSWSPSGGSTSYASGLNSGTYTCSVTDGNGCATQVSVQVVADSVPVVNAGASVTIGYGNSVQLTGSGQGNYNWSPATALSCTSCPNPVASPLATTIYVLTVTNAAGCSSQADVTVTIDYECGEIFVPNAFSPNGDGENDLHCVMGRCIQSMAFSVYDRWGEKVFESSDQKHCWDGYFRGEALNSAVFVYYLKATLVTGQTITRKGNISLVR